MIVVTGATGALNGATVNHLLDRVPPTELAVVAREPARAQRFAERGVEVRRGDYTQPQTLPAAFEGADQLLLVSSNDRGGDIVAQHRAAVDAAVTAGVGRVLYTSHQGAHPDSPFGPGRDHAQTERLLADSGLPWTSLRNGFYLHSLTWLLGPWRETGVITITGDGPVSWTARSDSAEAAAVVLTSDGAYDGPVTITANAAPTFADVAQLAGEVTGGKIELRVLDRDAWTEARVASGQQASDIGFLPSMYQAAREGYFAGIDPLLTQLLGREPRSVREHLEAEVAGLPSATAG